MSIRSIKVGVIGLGVGEQHLIAYRDIPGVDVCAICDIDPTKLEEVGQRYQISKRHTEWRDIVDDPEIDVVSVCSYDDGHAEQCIAAFGAGKHVMVEKPVTLYRKEAEAVLRAQQDSGRLITSNLILRQSPRFKELKRQIANGEFGEIFCIEGDYIHDILWKITRGWRGKMEFYSTIYGGGIHLIDLMRWLTVDEVTEVSCMSNKVLTRDTDYPFDDTFITTLRFGDGALGKCLSTYGPQRTKFHSLNIYGTRKTFVNGMPHGQIFTSDKPEDEQVMEVPYPGIEKGDLIPDFIAAIREGRDPNVSAKDVFRVMDICFAAVEAAETKRSIQVNYLI